MTDVLRKSFRSSMRVGIILGITAIAYLIGLLLKDKFDAKSFPVFSLFSTNVAHADAPAAEAGGGGGGWGETCETAGCETGEGGAEGAECCF